jgi:hypothetical protein
MVLGGDSDGDGVGDNVGGPLDPNGGTLVYNRRGTVVPGIPGCTVEVGEGQSCEDAGGEIIPAVDRGAGPLNDPTAMMYVRLEDLVPGKAVIDTVGNVETGQDEYGNPVYGIGPDYVDDRCQELIGVTDPADPAYDPTNPPYDINLTLAGCPVKVAATAPVEPLVLRANAGQCLEVTLHNKLIDQAQAANKPVYSCWIIRTSRCSRQRKRKQRTTIQACCWRTPTAHRWHSTTSSSTRCRISPAGRT